MKKLFLPLLVTLLSFTAAIGQTITGPTSACVGTNTTLSGSPGGGTWTCTAPGIITSGGVITGTLAGTSFVTYSTGSGSAVVPFTLNPNPSAITGPASSLILCATVTLSSTPAGGTWTSSNPAVVAVNPTTGVITGMSFGMPPTITYTLPTGCSATIMTSVTPASVVVSGVGRVCVGNSTPFTGSVSGFMGTVTGTWSSSTSAVATVSASGIVTGITTGTATISFTPSCGISGVKVVTVTATGAAGPITGSPSICAGSFSTLSCTPSGGTWSSSNSSVATVPFGSTVYGVAAGTATISYVYAACPSGTATVVATVNAAPASCPGTPVVCVGSTTTITCPGTWSGGAPLASVTPSGVVTGLSQGWAVLTYTNAAGCINTDSVSVLYAPSAISGTTSLCAGTTSTLFASPGGGMWGSSNPSIATVSSAGVVTAVAPGTALITYGLTTGCSSSVVLTIGAAGPTCTGLPPLCEGASTTLTCAGSGATWSTSGPNASITPSGVVTGIAYGSAVLTYTTATGCTSTVFISIAMTPGAISGPSTICTGSTATLSTGLFGATWSSSNPSVASVISTTPGGVVTGLTPGTTTITQTTSFGCSSSTVPTVVGGSGAITITTTPATCGSGYVLTASGGGGYTWTPSAGLSCSTCSSITVNPSTTTTYVVSGVVGGCFTSATAIVGGANRIYGHINFAMGMPSVPTCKVWLVQYNPLDSSITALDSVLTCMDGGTPYYQFNSVPSGSYFVKARLLSSVTGTSGYVPTYGTSTPNWYAATNIVHGSVGNVQNINMVYGTVPAGPGFISGYVYAGAGKGTSDGAPVAGMLIYLRSNVGAVLSHTYTDASGAYTFSGIANGSYVIYPEEYDYYTTPSSILAISASTPNVSGVNFKQNTNKGTITPLPIVVNGVNNVVGNNGILVYPNPASGNVFVQWMNLETGSADVLITDVLGREVFHSKINMATTSGEAQLNTNSMNAGVYSISIKANNNMHTERLLIQK